MNLMDLWVRIAVDDSGVKQGMGEVKATVSDASATITAKAVAIGNALYKVGETAVGAFKRIGQYAFDVGTAFDSSMASVAAISSATGDDLDALTEKAKEMGAKTKFSASESADAFTYMAMAGWKTEEMLGGIEGIMNLAAASGENLASVSDIVTDALTAFGLSAQDSGHFADVLAAASNNANTNVSMLGGSFKYVAPVAGALGYSIEDVSVALGLMANSGIKAEQAGTSMRSMLSRLAKPTKEVYAGFDQIGISAEEAMTNADGSMKPLSETLGILREKMSGLSEAEQANVAASIAGQEAMSGLLAIVNTSDADYQKLTDAIANADGTAEHMADVMLDNLPGAITIMKSAMEGLGVAIYENGSGAMQGFVERMTEAIGRMTEFVENGGLNDLIEGFRNLLPIINGVTAAIVTYKAAMAISGVIEAVKKSTESLSIAQAILNAVMKANPFVLIVSLLAALVTALVTAYMTNEEFREKVNAAWKSVKDTISNAVTAIKTFFTETIPNAAKTALEWFQSIPDQMKEIGANMVRGLWEGIKNMAEWIKEKVSGFFGGIVDNVKGVLGIHSPSRVFAGIGENMALGLGEGWESEYGTIKRGITSGLDFGTATVGFSDSGIGRSSAAIVNSMGVSTEGGTTTINLMFPDGTKLASYLLPFSIKAAAAAGTPIANAQMA